MTDFIIIGGGIAGAAAAFFLSEHGEVTLIERESAPGYHTTGRSAALYTENYGNAAIRALTVASRPFFDAPPAGFSESPLLHPRGVVMIAPAGQEAAFEDALDEGRRHTPGLHEIPIREAVRLCPMLNPAWAARALHEPEAMDMDVHAIHQGYLRGLRARGSRLIVDAELQGLERTGGSWIALTKAGRFAAPVVVDAAGAWADEVARLAGIAPVGLVPKRRTAFTVDQPDGLDAAAWPMLIDVAETFYVKPESGRLLVSPADETPMPPCDVQPDEIDIATAAARVEAATSIRVHRVVHKWAGLRSFVRDKTIVAGEAPGAPGFFWLAGQGGYGIMTSPAMGRVAAALATGRAFPGDIAAHGVSAADLAPDRPSLGAAA